MIVPMWVVIVYRLARRTSKEGKRGSQARGSLDLVSLRALKDRQIEQAIRSAGVRRATRCVLVHQ